MCGLGEAGKRGVVGRCDSVSGREMPCGESAREQKEEGGERKVGFNACIMLRESQIKGPVGRPNRVG